MIPNVAGQTNSGQIGIVGFDNTPIVPIKRQDSIKMAGEGCS